MRFDERNQLVDYVVEYRACIGGEWCCVRRYDASHGRPHIDIFDPVQGKRKRWLNTADRGAAYSAALDDLDKNWSLYRAEYERRLSE